MSGTHFYITLPSNASMDIFPDNSTSTFRVKLPQTIDLTGNWEVGLYSFTYPRTWYNLQENDSSVYYSNDGLVFLGSFIGYGYYASVQDLVDSVNKVLLDGTKGNISMTFDTRTEKVKVHPQNGYYFAIDGILSVLLGFGGKSIRISKDTTSPYVADITGAMSSIFVYCNLVKHQVVGDTNVPLLRCIPIEGRIGSIVNKTYTNIRYVPIQQKSFEDVEILLRADTGKPISFERGKVLLTLHFRRESFHTLQ